MAEDHAFIQSIYNTALNQKDLPNVLQEFAERVGAFGSMIFDCTTQNGLRRVGLVHHSATYDTDDVLLYVKNHNDAEVADQDRLADLSSSRDGINLIHDAKLFEGLAQPGSNVVAMQRFGIASRYGALLSKESWNTDRFAFQFAHGTPLPPPEQVIWAEHMLSHLAKALSIGRALNQAQVLETALQQFMDGLGIGVAVVGPSSQLIYANDEMQRILQDRPEVQRNSAGQLEFAQIRETADVHFLLEGEDAHGNYGARPRREAVIFPASEGERPEPLFVEICPINHHPELDRFGKGSRLLTILDGSRAQKLDAQAVGKYFPLSANEIDVLGHVADGLSNAEIAVKRGRSAETVKSQLQSLLRKTASRNRTELVKVAVSLAQMPSISEDDT